MDFYMRYFIDATTATTTQVDRHPNVMQQNFSSIEGRKGFDHREQRIKNRYQRQQAEEESISSHTISTQSAYSRSSRASKHVIANMHLMGVSNESFVSGSHQSQQSGRSSRISRSTSKSNRRKRGSSLERAISKTILQVASGRQGADFSANEDASTASSSADFILQDLLAVDRALQSETASLRSSSYNSVGEADAVRMPLLHRLANLLPPVTSFSQEQANCKAEFSKTSDYGRTTVKPRTGYGPNVTSKPRELSVQETSHAPSAASMVRSPCATTAPPHKKTKQGPVNEIPAPPAVAHKSTAASKESTSFDPFADLDRNTDYSSSLWPDDDGWGQSSGVGSSFGPEMVQKDSLCLSPEWTTFDDNPFQDCSVHPSVDHLDNTSTDSPSSIADFGSKSGDKRRAATRSAVGCSEKGEESVPNRFSI